MAEKKAGMSLIKKILLGLAVVVIAFLGIVAVQPSTFRVERSATFAAPPEKVFSQVNDFHNWDAWSPWAKLDPNVKNSFDGPAAGEGAKFHWNGNNDVGEGGMTITESKPGELVRIKLDFIRPMASTSTTEFTFEGEGNQTRINWAMFGENDFMGKAFCLFMNMDKMIGGDFERGLASMKKIVEAPTPAPTDEKLEPETKPEQ